MVVLGFAIGSFSLFWKTVHPAKVSIGATPERYFLDAERVTITTSDRIRLSGWLIPRAESPGDMAVILLHGYPATKSDLLPLAAVMHPRVATLLLDLRSFGESGGRVTTLGLREREDVRASVDFLASRGFKHIGVFGISLGGAVGIMAAEEDDRIGAVAAYAPFSDLQNLANETYASLGPLRQVLIAPLFLWARLVLDGDIRAASPLLSAPHLTKPVFLAHNRKDEAISFRNAQRLEIAFRDNPRAEFYFPENGGHNDIPNDLYLRLTDFFLRSLGASDPSLGQ